MKFRYNLTNVDHGYFAEVERFYLCNTGVANFCTPYPDRIHISTTKRKKKNGWFKVKVRVALDRDTISVEWKSPKAGQKQWMTGDESMCNWLMRHVFPAEDGYLDRKATIWIKFTED